MKAGDRIQETGDSKIKGVTMAEVDAHYKGLLKELQELEEMLEKDKENGSQGIPANRKSCN